MTVILTPPSMLIKIWLLILMLWLADCGCNASVRQQGALWAQRWTDLTRLFKNWCLYFNIWFITVSKCCLFIYFYCYLQRVWWRGVRLNKIKHFNIIVLLEQDKNRKLMNSVYCFRMKLKLFLLCHLYFILNNLQLFTHFISIFSSYFVYFLFMCIYLISFCFSLLIVTFNFFHFLFVFFNVCRTFVLFCHFYSPPHIIFILHLHIYIW